MNFLYLFIAFTVIFMKEISINGADKVKHGFHFRENEHSKSPHKQNGSQIVSYKVLKGVDSSSKGEMSMLPSRSSFRNRSSLHANKSFNPRIQAKSKRTEPLSNHVRRIRRESNRKFNYYRPFLKLIPRASSSNKQEQQADDKDTPILSYVTDSMIVSSNVTTKAIDEGFRRESENNVRKKQRKKRERRKKKRSGRSRRKLERRHIRNNQTGTLATNSQLNGHLKIESDSISNSQEMEQMSRGSEKLKSESKRKRRKRLRGLNGRRNDRRKIRNKPRKKESKRTHKKQKRKKTKERKRRQRKRKKSKISRTRVPAKLINHTKPDAHIDQTFNQTTTRFPGLNGHKQTASYSSIDRSQMIKHGSPMNKTKSRTRYQNANPVTDSDFQSDSPRTSVIDKLRILLPNGASIYRDPTGRKKYLITYTGSQTQRPPISRGRYVIPQRSPANPRPSYNRPISTSSYIRGRFVPRNVRVFVYRYAPYIPLVYGRGRYAFVRPTDRPMPSRITLYRLMSSCNYYNTVCDEAMDRLISQRQATTPAPTTTTTKVTTTAAPLSTVFGMVRYAPATTTNFVYRYSPFIPLVFGRGRYAYIHPRNRPAPKKHTLIRLGGSCNRYDWLCNEAMMVTSILRARRYPLTPPVAIRHFVYRYAPFIPLVYGRGRYVYRKPVDRPEPSKSTLNNLQISCDRYNSVCDDAMKSLNSELITTPKTLDSTGTISTMATTTMTKAPPTTTTSTSPTTMSTTISTTKATTKPPKTTTKLPTTTKSTPTTTESTITVLLTTSTKSPFPADIVEFVYKYKPFIPLAYGRGRYRFVRPLNTPIPTKAILYKLRACCYNYIPVCENAMNNNSSSSTTPPKSPNPKATPMPSSQELKPTMSTTIEPVKTTTMVSELTPSKELEYKPIKPIIPSVFSKTTAPSNTAAHTVSYPQNVTKELPVNPIAEITDEIPNKEITSPATSNEQALTTSKVSELPTNTPISTENPATTSPLEVTSNKSLEIATESRPTTESQTPETSVATPKSTVETTSFSPADEITSEYSSELPSKTSKASTESTTDTSKGPITTLEGSETPDNAAIHKITSKETPDYTDTSTMTPNDPGDAVTPNETSDNHIKSTEEPISPTEATDDSDDPATPFQQSEDSDMPTTASEDLSSPTPENVVTHGVTFDDSTKPTKISEDPVISTSVSVDPFTQILTSEDSVTPTAVSKDPVVTIGTSKDLMSPTRISEDPVTYTETSIDPVTPSMKSTITSEGPVIQNVTSQNLVTPSVTSADPVSSGMTSKDPVTQNETEGSKDSKTSSETSEDRAMSTETSVAPTETLDTFTDTSSDPLMSTETSVYLFKSTETSYDPLRSTEKSDDPITQTSDDPVKSTEVETLDDPVTPTETSDDPVRTTETKTPGDPLTSTETSEDPVRATEAKTSDDPVTSTEAYEDPVKTTEAKISSDPVTSTETVTSTDDPIRSTETKTSDDPVTSTEISEDLVRTDETESSDDPVTPTETANDLEKTTERSNAPMKSTEDLIRSSEDSVTPSIESTNSVSPSAKAVDQFTPNKVSKDPIVFNTSAAGKTTTSQPIDEDISNKVEDSSKVSETSTDSSVTENTVEPTDKSTRLADEKTTEKVLILPDDIDGSGEIEERLFQPVTIPIPLMK